MVRKWPFLKLEFSGFFLPKLKNTLVKNICDFCYRFWSNWDLPSLALQNDCQNLNFEKVVCSWQNKWQEIVVKWPNAKVVSFFSNRLWFRFLHSRFIGTQNKISLFAPACKDHSIAIWANWKVFTCMYVLDFLLTNSFFSSNIWFGSAHLSAYLRG